MPKTVSGYDRHNRSVIDTTATRLLNLSALFSTLGHCQGKGNHVKSQR